MKMKILERKYFFYIVSVVYRLCLDFSYVEFINPIYNYAGFHYNFSYSNYLISWLFTFTLVFFTPNILNKVSDYFLVTFSFSILIPMLCMYGLDNELNIEVIFVNLIAYFIIYLSLRFKFFNHKITYPFIKDGENIFRVLCYSMIFYLVFWYIVSGAINNFNLDLTKVYEFRDTNAELTGLGFLAYLNSWVLNVFNLSLIAYSLLKKRYFLLYTLVLIQILFFGVSAHKSVLFTPLVIYSIYFYFSKTKSLATVPLAFSIIIMMCTIIYLYDDDIFYGSLIVRRVFFVPNHLSYVYYDFFSKNPFAYWTNSFSFLGTTVYPNGIPATIGSYLGSDELKANNGFISSGYAQAGIWGVFIYVVLMTFILKFIDQMSKDIGALWFALCIVITPLRAVIISSDLLTVLLTHGLFIAMLLIFLLRKRRLKDYD